MRRAGGRARPAVHSLWPPDFFWSHSSVPHGKGGFSIPTGRPPCLGTVVRVADTRLPYSPRLSPVRQMRNPVGGSWFGAVFGPPQSILAGADWRELPQAGIHTHDSTTKVTRTE